MRTARASVTLPAPASAAEELWYDLARWPSFVDGFAAVRRSEGDWPHEGSVLVWDSTPAGRGRVVERVTRYEPRAGQVAEVEDTQLEGTQEIAFRPGPDQVQVELSLAYTLKQSGAFLAVADLVFIRRAVRDSLRRTLVRFGRELAGDRSLGVT